MCLILDVNVKICSVYQVVVRKRFKERRIKKKGIQMEIASKFRFLFLVRKNIFFFLFVTFILFALLHDLSNPIQETILILILFLGFCIIIQLIRLRSLSKIIVSDKGIRKISIISGIEEFIPFSSIENIQRQRIQGMSNMTGQITDGYYETLINLRNKKKLLITPDHFENYQEIIKAIRNRYESE